MSLLIVGRHLWKRSKGGKRNERIAKHNSTVTVPCETTTQLAIKRDPPRSGSLEEKNHDEDRQQAWRYA